MFLFFVVSSFVTNIGQFPGVFMIATIS